MEYNTQLKPIRLAEYGRNIQNMVNHCHSLEDREERTRCAYTIIELMGNTFPHLRDVNDFKHILWDHLAIMSNFELDIDYPYDIIKKEELLARPKKMAYSEGRIRYMHYGKTLEKMVTIATEMSDGEEKDQFIELVATHMKKSYIQWNKEVNDNKIFLDIYELSEGKIDIRNSDMKLPDPRENQPRNQQQQQQQRRPQRRR